MKNFFGKLKGNIALVLVSLLAVASQAADYSELSGTVVADISGASSTLMGIAAAIIGVGVIFVIYRFIRKMVG